MTAKLSGGFIPALTEALVERPDIGVPATQSIPAKKAQERHSKNEASAAHFDGLRQTKILNLSERGKQKNRVNEGK